MNNIVMLLSLPDFSEFLDNPTQVITSVLTSSFGEFGYILIMFCLITLVWTYTKNAFSVGIFIVIYGVVADILYPPEFAVMINLLGIGVIFGGVVYKGIFASD